MAQERRYNIPATPEIASNYHLELKEFMTVPLASNETNAPQQQNESAPLDILSSNFAAISLGEGTASNLHLRYE